jgi:23S rRNA pseudouridine2605 synthase
MHPSNRIQREYIVRALGDLSPAQIERLRRGVRLEDGEARFASVELMGGEGANRSYRVIVSEGRNRLVRRLFDAVGCKVNRLLRVRYGPIRLPRELRPGEYRELSEAERGQLESI